MNVSDIINACGALIAVMVAIFVFLFTNSLQTYQTRSKSMISTDMPRFIRTNTRFRLEIFLDTAGQFFLAWMSLVMAIWFAPILVNAIAVNIGQNPIFLFSATLPQEFLNGAEILWWILAGMLGLSAMYFLAGKQVSKNLPLTGC
jgi:hypothetical protein